MSQACLQPLERERERERAQLVRYPHCSLWRTPHCGGGMVLKELQSVENSCWNRFILKDGACGKDHGGAEEECGNEGTAERSFCLCFSPLF